MANKDKNGKAYPALHFKKTPAAERGEYRYRFCNGDVSVIAGSEETEVIIRTLHSIDDSEVYHNIKGSRPPVEGWQKDALEKWKAEHPGEEPEKNWNLSMDGLKETENPDNSIYAKQLAEMTSEETDPQKEILYGALSEMPREDQTLYFLYFIAGYKQREIAEMLKVSQNTVSRRLRILQDELTEKCRREIAQE